MHNKQLIPRLAPPALVQMVRPMPPPPCGMIRSGLCRPRGPRH